MSRTRAAEIRTKAVSPESRAGAAGAAAGSCANTGEALRNTNSRKRRVADSRIFTQPPRKWRTVFPQNRKSPTPLRKRVQDFVVETRALRCAGVGGFFTLRRGECQQFCRTILYQIKNL